MKTLATFFALAFLPLAAGRAQGTIKASSSVRPDGSMLTTVTNPDTKTREQTITEKGGKVLSRTIYFLNEQNLAWGATHLDGSGKVRYKEVYTFDAASRPAESKLYTPTTGAAGKRTFVYSGKRVFIYDRASQTEARVEDYDAAGTLLTGTAKAGRGAPTEVRRATPVR